MTKIFNVGDVVYLRSDILDKRIKMKVLGYYRDYPEYYARSNPWHSYCFNEVHVEYINDTSQKDFFAEAQLELTNVYNIVNNNQNLPFQIGDVVNLNDGTERIGTVRGYHRDEPNFKEASLEKQMEEYDDVIVHFVDLSINKIDKNHFPESQLTHY